MYSLLKKALVRLLPRPLLFRFEHHLRALYALAFAGSRYQCNICGRKLRTFITAPGDVLCPGCGSGARNRRLWDLLGAELLNNNPRILHFSPSRCLYRLFKKGDYDYTGSDLSGDFIADAAYDLTHVDTPDGTFDLVLCYHILEHIEDDARAMRELYRILAPGGCCVVQTPFKDGDTYEDPAITSPGERAVHFGQDDHVRIYSVNGLAKRLEQAGFKVEIRGFNAKPGNRNGFQEHETVLTCRK